MLEIVLVMDNLRSIHNVGALLRVADAMGVTKVCTLGITPSGHKPGVLPHIRDKEVSRLSKTALGAEMSVEIRHFDETTELLAYLKQSGYYLLVLEQAPAARPLDELSPLPATKIALVVGHETKGVNKTLLGAADQIVAIPMSGQKNSLNVATAGAIALYRLRQISTSHP